MLRPLGRVMLQVKRSGAFKLSEKINVKIYPGNLCQSLSAIQQQSCTLREENTLSHKVLEYMRVSPEYATSFSSLPDQMSLTSPLNTSEVHQRLHVIADSKESKPCDILMLFTQYVSQKTYMEQDIATKKELMFTVKERILQTIPQMTLTDLKQFAMIIKNMNFKKSRYLTDIATCIGNECGRRASVADLEHCLKLFDILLLLHGNHFHRNRQFDVFMSLFEMHTAKAKPHYLVQILHYTGIAKKTRLNQEYVQLLVTKLQEVFEHLSFIDAGIALGGIFRCNVKLKKSSLLVKQTAKSLQRKGEKLGVPSDLEWNAFVGMIKVIRAAKYQDETLLKSLSNFVMKSAPNVFQPELIAHTLALYANSQIYDPEVFTKFEYLTLQHLSGHAHIIRSKDISRILWSFSHVGHKVNDNFFEMVEKVLVRLLNVGQFNFYPEHLSGSLFSLAMFGHYPRELIKEAFKPENIAKLQGYQRSKQLSRLWGLYEAMKIEAPDICVALPEMNRSVLPKRTLADEIKYHPALANLMKGVNFINKSVGLCVLELKFPVPFINFASLIFNARGPKMQEISKNFVSKELRSIGEVVGANRIAFEIIDSHSLVLGSEDFIGILKMKIRLMKQCGWAVYTIFEDDVNMFNCDEKTMAAFILETLSKIKM